MVSAKQKLIIRFVVWVIVFLLVVVASFFWNESRKEIVYLCGNFVSGVEESSVRRQLDTGNLLTYHTESTSTGRRIIAQSVFNLYFHQCTVTLDPDGIVIDHHLD